MAKAKTAAKVTATKTPAVVPTTGSVTLPKGLTPTQVRVLTYLSKNPNSTRKVMGAALGKPKGWAKLMGAPMRGGGISGANGTGMQALGYVTQVPVGGTINASITKAGTAALAAHNKANK